MEFAEKVRFYRRVANVTQIELARAIERSQSWVQRVETGYTRPLPEDIQKLEAALGVELREEAAP